ncbi:MAG TPA: group III truncated hemoglobin [Candidatus Limnocylindria bacterium]|jgi:hemoglobin|nr:group III truncated hemoglobin [Candidatus Limnocylindria bacterium]
MQPSLYDRLGGRPALDRLVAAFYGEAQNDPVLGSVFAAQIHDWPSHLVTVADFWSTQTGGPPLYCGGMGKHIRLGLRPEHFSRWLALWEQTAAALFGAGLATELIALARVVATRLQEMAAGFSGLRVG